MAKQLAHGRRKARTSSTTSSNRYKKTRPKRTLKPNTRFFGPLVAWGVGSAICLGLFAALSLGLFAAYRWMMEQTYFTVARIEVSGNDRLSEAEVLEAGKLSVGRNLLDVNMNEVEASLLANPWIEEVTVKRELPDAIVVGIKERMPDYWALHEQQLFYADARGKLIAPVTPDGFKACPIIKIAPGAEELMETFYGLMQRARESGSAVVFQDASWIRVGQDRSVEVFFEDSRLLLSIGMDRWEENLARIGLVQADLQRRGEQKSIGEIKAFASTVWLVRTG